MYLALIPSVTQYRPIGGVKFSVVNAGEIQRLLVSGEFSEDIQLMNMMTH